MTVEAFGIEKEFLRDILKEVGEGKAQLPEFQRDWVWPDQNVISLLASVSLGYPVGTIMMLRSGGGGVRFQVRPIQGATPPPSAKAERLVLDGQQRLTALYQSLMLQSPVKAHDIRKKPLEGWLYVDIQKALDPSTDREEAIRMLPPDRKIRNFRGEVMEDYSTRQQEYAAQLFPLNHVFDDFDWYMGYQEYWEYNKEKMLRWNHFHQEVLDRFTQYLLPVIELGKDTQREAVCQVFEKVNTGGVTLTVFELLTATYAADEYDLRNDWSERRAELRKPETKVLHNVADTDFLQTVTLLATYHKRLTALKGGEEAERAPRIGCRRNEMLVLKLDEYRQWALAAVEGLKRAAIFLHTQYLYDTKFLPYGSQLIPLAAIFAVLGKEADTQSAQEKIARWFWCGVLGELYGGTTETRFGRDLPEVVDWVRNGSEPRTIEEAVFSSSRLQTLRTRLSAAYKGIYALLLREGAADWQSGKQANIAAYFDSTIDIHHIFPKAWCEAEHIPAHRYDSIVNKTPLSAHTNRVIGGRAPSEYLPRVANGAGITMEKLEQNLLSHHVVPEYLHKDDFDGFVAARSKAILDRIGEAMGKPVIQSPESDESIAWPNDEVDDDE